MSCATATARNGARLREVARCIPPGTRIVDVGSDHGLLPRLLLRDRHIRSCIATERRPGGALERLAGRDPRLAIRFGDGLAALEPGDAFEVVVISGLGSRSMIRILAHGNRLLDGLSRLVLQPQSEWSRLRRWLHAHDYRLVDERLIGERGRHYLILAAEPGQSAEPVPPGLTVADLHEAGPLLLRQPSPAVVAYWNDRLARAETAARAAHKGDGAAQRRLAAQVRQARRILAALRAHPPGS